MESSSSNHKACVLKIDTPTKGWKKKLENLLNTINDVNFTIDKRSKTVYVYGKINPQKILENITKAGQKAEIIWSDEENRRNNSMEQCNQPGFKNAPTGFSNHQQQPQWSYHQPPNNLQQQQWSYHQPNRMNQFQPHPQTFAPPPPYVRQFHPQPPPPPPYTFQQNEPVAKSFPPTPAPPKNFTMGDLQCTIM